MSKLFAQPPKSDADLQAHIAALKRLQSHSAYEKAFDHLYSCLTILDSKSTSLLSFNSIIIAVFALFLTAKESLGRFGGIAVGVGISAVIISCFLLLSVVWVQWSTTKEFSEPDHHNVKLLRIRWRRTIRYQLAWCFTVIAILSLSVFLIGRVWLVV
jgi:hypothetical protein